MFLVNSGTHYCSELLGNLSSLFFFSKITSLHPKNAFDRTFAQKNHFIFPKSVFDREFACWKSQAVLLWVEKCLERINEYKSELRLTFSCFWKWKYKKRFWSFEAITMHEIDWKVRESRIELPFAIEALRGVIHRFLVMILLIYWGPGWIQSCFLGPQKSMVLPWNSKTALSRFWCLLLRFDACLKIETSVVFTHTN